MRNFQEDCKKQRILVITGTTGFDSLIKNIDECRELEHNYEFVLQIGEGKYLPKFKKFIQFDKTLNKKLDDYDFFITHAGAGTIFMLLEQRKRVLVVPNTDRADKHQLELANYVLSSQLCAVCLNVNDIVPYIDDIDVKTARLMPYEKKEFNATREILRYIYE
ncbi:MAG: hypothetical protein RI964_707 [Pseudomonadota bacterium]|jgi:beta-1,4-N-acetylglucosaminyltransferase